MRNRFVLAADFPLIASAAIAAFALRFDWLFFESRPEFLPFLAAALLVKPVVFYLCGLYARYWRYASVHDLMAVVFAVSAASGAMSILLVIALASGIVTEFSRSVMFNDWCLTVLLIGGLRISVRMIAESRRRSPSGSAHSVRSVLLAGAGHAGAMVVREVARNQHLGMQVIGYLDDDPAKRHKWIYGVQVLGAIDELAPIAKRYRADEVVITMPRAAGAAVRRVTELATAAGLPSKTIPGVYEMLDAVPAVRQLREVEISDLLRRPQIESPPTSSSYVGGRVVLVTGAGGSIGSELCRQVAFSQPARLVMLGHGENSLFEARERLRESFPALRLDVIVADVRDEFRMNTVFNDLKPAVVFHAAAHKHVPLMEDNPIEAVTNNVFGTWNVVRAAVAAGTDRFVFISTDKAVAPSSIMGATKRLGERIVRQAAKDCGRAFVAVRFGNVLGSRGSVIPTFKRQIERGGPVTVTHPEMRRFFMTIPEAVHLVVAAGGLGNGGELFVLEMGEPIRIVDLARDVIRLSGLAPDAIPIQFSGLRPGEKLTEALWEENAVIERTEQDGVLRVLEEEIDDFALATALRQLNINAHQNSPRAVHVALMDALPSYGPFAIDPAHVTPS